MKENENYFMYSQSNKNENNSLLLNKRANEIKLNNNTTKKSNQQNTESNDTQLKLSPNSKEKIQKSLLKKEFNPGYSKTEIMKAVKNNELILNDCDEAIIEEINNTQNTKDQMKFFEKMGIYMDNLVASNKYEKSYMHRDILSMILSIEASNFIITVSEDGILKFWKKLFLGIDFIKQYKAHIAKPTGLAHTVNGQYLVTCCDKDCMLKTFDIENYDLIHMMKLSFEPLHCLFINKTEDPELLVLVTEKENGNMNILKACGNSDIIKTILIHDYSISCLAFNYEFSTLISCDSGGYIEINDISKTRSKEKKNVETTLIENLEDSKLIKYNIKSETDLFELSNLKVYGYNITISNTLKYFAIVCSDHQIRFFSLKTGKLKYQYDESIQFYINALNKAYDNKNKEEAKIKDKHSSNSSNYEDSQEKQEQNETKCKEEDNTQRLFGLSLDVLLSRIKKEKEVHNAQINVEFDKSDNFIYYSTLVGIKLVHLKSNKLIKILGLDENERFLGISLFQGKALKNTLGNIGKGARRSQDDKLYDPTIFAFAFKKNRFYLFTQREPDIESTYGISRDILNEKPTSKEIQQINEIDKKELPENAIIDTSHGEIYIKLYPNECPKTIKNFVGLAKNGFYDNLIFHKVVKNFVIQTGCPYGNGKGGHSIWGDEFEDEFTPLLKHDRPYTVAMANRGPGTNGSQFYITTAAAPWLDNKHTVFGRVFKGMDTVHAIENVECDGKEKPLLDVKMYKIRIIDSK